MNVNSIRYQVPNYPMYGVKENGLNRSSSEFIQDTLAEIEMNQCETKVNILRDKYLAKDITPEQKFIIGDMLRDANKELVMLKIKYNVG